MHDDTEPLDPVLREAITNLRDTPPASDLWATIAPRLSMRRPKGSILLRWPAALAAGVAIALVSAGGTHYLMRVQPTTRAAVTSTTTPVTTVAYSAADSTLESAIRQLEGSLRSTMAQLDAPTRQGISRSLDVLDRAIAEAAARRASAPDDLRAENYLTNTLRKKLGVLRTVSTLTARQS